MYDTEVVRLMCDMMYRHFPTLHDDQKHHLLSILVSLKMLGHKDPTLLDDIVDALFWGQVSEGDADARLSDAEAVRRVPTDVLTSVLVSCAGLNHLPQRLDTDAVVEVILKKMEAAQYSDARVLLNTVHALVMLQIGSAALMEQVLEIQGERAGELGTGQCP